MECQDTVPVRCTVAQSLIQAGRGKSVCVVQSLIQADEGWSLSITYPQCVAWLAQSLTQADRSWSLIHSIWLGGSVITGLESQRVTHHSVWHGGLVINTSR